MRIDLEFCFLSVLFDLWRGGGLLLPVSESSEVGQCMHVIVQNAKFMFLPLGVAISKECNLIFFRLKGLYMTDKVCRYMDLYTRGDVMKIGILFRTVKLFNR